MKSIVFNLAFVIVLDVVWSYTTSKPDFKRLPDDDSDPYKPIDSAPIPAKEKLGEYWRNQAQNYLHDKLERNKMNTNRAKNIIFFLGDGLSVPTITAARIYQGQLKNKTGEENELFFEKFPYTGLSKTYCTNKQVADSAATATAYLCGVKANFATIGVTAAVEVADCERAKLQQNRPSSIVQWAQQAGKSTGVVTTTRVTHASPAGCYAHVPTRDMESDYDVIKQELDPKSCNYDIAKQLIFDEPGKNIKVILGGGRSKFLRKEDTKYGTGGQRLDMNLVDEWKKDKESKNANSVYVTNTAQLKQIDIHKTDYLLGLFNAQHLKYHLDKTTDEEEPTLSEMTETAIKLLQKDADGFYLFVEGGKIDMAHHLAHARVALDETIEFAKAIETAYKLTNSDDTLIVVTADHAHTMSMSGYPARGNDILGLYGRSADNLPYLTLGYANGPGYHAESAAGKRYNLEYDHTNDVNYTFPSMVPKEWESHGGDDVAVYASGPWSHLFSGNYEQNYIPIAEAYAAKIGPSKITQSFANINSFNYRIIVFCMVLVSSRHLRYRIL